MLNKDSLHDLLRTNSASKYLVRRSQNEYVSHLRELLNALGYGAELQWSRLGNAPTFGSETSAAVNAFAANNKIPFDSITVSPLLLTKMLQCHEALEGVRLLKRSYNQKQLQQAFNLYDPNNHGVEQLLRILEVLGIYEPFIGTGLRTYLQRKGLPASYSNQLTESVASALLADIVPAYGKGIDFYEPTMAQTNPLPPRELSIVEQGQTLLVTDGSVTIGFLRKNAGLYTLGNFSVEQFMADKTQALTEAFDLTPSALSIIKAISSNEGHLDAINTYDGGFLSFGIFQWTLGKLNNPGELPALLKKIKTAFPSTYNDYFTAFGIDISPATNTTEGILTYNGVPALSADEKEKLRGPDIAFRFWKAGRDTNVQAVQIEHALSRLKNFYWRESAAGYPLNQVITSAYGVALLLDNHVNRPAWVSKCLTLGIQNAGVTLPPYYWSDADEQRVLAAYLNVRETYQESGYAPMTASRLRATKIYNKVLNSQLSDRRGSFQMSELAMRSVQAPAAYDTTQAILSPEKGNIVLPPPYYAPEDYPPIRMENYDR